VRFLLQALAAAVGFWLASKVVQGVHASSLQSLLAAGLILGVVNAVVRPVLIFLTIPLTLVTFGLFLLVINGITVWMTAEVLRGVRIDGLGPAILTALIITAMSWLTRAVFSQR
jgi:putative membrane protein